MEKKKWKTKIKKAVVEVGTYKPAFDAVIDALAEILEKRDEVYLAYDGKPIVEHTNSHGETNRMKNPALMLWDDFNKTAITYWRELGMTPAGLKKLTEASFSDGKGGGQGLGSILKSIQNETQ